MLNNSQSRVTTATTVATTTTPLVGRGFSETCASSLQQREREGETQWVAAVADQRCHPQPKGAYFVWLTNALLT